MVMAVLNGDVNEGQVLTDGQTTLDVVNSTTAYDSTTACAADFCQNGGTCNVTDRYPFFTYTCSCAEGYTGTQCESTAVEVTTTAAPDCSLSCLNGGTLDAQNCNCSCANSFSGTTCSDCSLSCLNGGTLDAQNCNCSCAQAFNGTTCSECPLTDASCSNEALFNETYCECVCPNGASGVTCEDPDPCQVTPNLCTGEGEFCRRNPYVAIGYSCECRELDGYVRDNGVCNNTVVMTITVVLRVLGVNGTAVFFKNVYNDPFAAATREFLSIVGAAIFRHLSLDPLTNDVLVIIAVAARPGSILVDAVAAFPPTSNATADMVMAVLNGDVNEGQVLTDGQTTLDVVNTTTAYDSTTACAADFCQNGGTCNVTDRYPFFTYTCSCAEGYTGTQCESEIMEFTTEMTTVVATTTAAPEPVATTVIVLVVLGVLALILTLFGLGVCCCILARRRQREDWRRRAYNKHLRRMAYGRRGSFGLEDSDVRTSAGGSAYNGSDYDDRRMGHLAQVLARSPYVQQNLHAEFARPYVATGLEELYYHQRGLNEDAYEDAARSSARRSGRNRFSYY